ncbi:uncharacterized protein DEA37_0010970 [Paragonimus westermani]|uniref:Uncharacterized protein n=1 Tax=Paragonimus westermani TaxID=34504 RepID=A0A5J4P2R5_9TREM|nr:uncharacterized protein DEA37_0010970 [Paragonimus westermani]
MRAFPVKILNVNEINETSEEGNGQPTGETCQHLRQNTRHQAILKKNFTLHKQPLNDACAFCCGSSAEAFTSSSEPVVSSAVVSAVNIWAINHSTFVCNEDHRPLAAFCLRREKAHTPPTTSTLEATECCADKQDNSTTNPVSTIPTILKRNTTGQSLQPELRRSSKHNSDANRRSRVVFSRTVLVSNGSETTQLNFPSDTDEENDRIYPKGAKHTVDDMVINRTSQPWIMTIKKDHRAHRPISCNEYAPVRFNRGVAMRGAHTPTYKRFVFNHEPLHIGTSLNAGPADLEISAHRNQHHHHNCQTVRHTSNQYAANYDSLK